MGRRRKGYSGGGAKRATDWFGVYGSATQSNGGEYEGVELIGGADVLESGPFTVTRIIGQVIASSSMPDDGEGSTAAFVSLSKSSLEKADSTVTLLDVMDADWLENENLLWNRLEPVRGGFSGPDSVGTSSTRRRPFAYFDIDCKAQRKFASPEERLVVTMGNAPGQVYDGVFVWTYSFRILLKF